jgi:phosphatidylinositol kinase/protein kinase (PI-3  family)
LKTFNIVPITNRLGALEWVQNTEPLKEMISRQHKAENKGKDLNESAALLKRRQFLKKLPAN